jgi:hypothetical protein
MQVLPTELPGSVARSGESMVIVDGDRSRKSKRQSLGPTEIDAAGRQSVDSPFAHITTSSSKVFSAHHDRCEHQSTRMEVRLHM